jgi:hypothetical protein
VIQDVATQINGKLENKTDESLSNSFSEKKNNLRSDTKKFALETALRLGHRNFRLHITLTVLSLLLTLALTIIGLLGDELITPNQRKVSTGVLGAILATLQTASASFNFKRKSEGYFSLDVKAKNLDLDIDESSSEEELKKCKECLKKLRSSALKLEL